MLDLQSEQFAPTGGMAGEGARRTLGRPALSRLELMVREAIQNSWDARAAESKSVLFRVDAYDLEKSHVSTLRKRIFGVLPEKIGLSGVLEKDDLRAIVVSDRGTIGLAGPTRTDEVTDETKHLNFVEFFRNVGRLTREHIGGGTYGFGKASLYELSHTDTIVVHSRIRDGSRIASRFMAAALGEQYRSRSRGRVRNLTGRHWWGVEEDGVVEPVTGRDADRLAESLGMPIFEGEETGTSILILEPRVRNEHETVSLERMCEIISEAALWYSWPHMLADRRRGQRLELRTFCNGRAVPILPVEEHAVLKEYARVFRHAVERDAGARTASATRLSRFEVNCLKPAQELGTLAVARVFSNLKAPAVSPEDEDGAMLSSVPGGVPSHVAIMRSPRLIVRYVPFPVPYDGTGFVGVFVANDELNALYAEAEPVTHDNWNCEGLERRRDQTFVRVTFRRIGELVREFLQPADQQGADGVELPLGGLSRFLGSLVATSRGTGAEAHPPGGSTGTKAGSPKAARIIALQESTLTVRDGHAIARFPMEIRGVKSGAGIRVRVRPMVVTADGSGEGEAPLGTEAPAIVGWESADSAIKVLSSTEVTFRAKSGDQLAVLVSVPQNAAVTIAPAIEVIASR